MSDEPQDPMEVINNPPPPTPTQDEADAMREAKLEGEGVEPVKANETDEQRKERERRQHERQQQERQRQEAARQRQEKPAEGGPGYQTR